MSYENCEGLAWKSDYEIGIGWLWEKGHWKTLCGDLGLTSDEYLVNMNKYLKMEWVIETFSYLLIRKDHVTYMVVKPPFL